MTANDADALLAQLSQWARVGDRIQREWTMPNFAAMLNFVRDVGDLAEDEGHHPDIHMTDYRLLRIVLWTHAISGLSENDFILAAKINRLWEQTQ
jgi:4a-hydroxytetrahydrobiopterin dehydratase